MLKFTDFVYTNTRTSPGRMYPREAFLAFIEAKKDKKDRIVRDGSEYELPVPADDYDREPGATDSIEPIKLKRT